MGLKFKVYFLISLILWGIQEIQAKEIKYKVADIPKELRENARSVVRNDINILEIKSLSSAVYKVTFAITVLNKNGIEDAEFHKTYDKFSKISGISAKVYDENGELVKRIKGDEISDYSAISGYSIYDDNRVKYFDSNYRIVPFTLEYSYEESFNGNFSYPDWTPYAGLNNISTEYSSFDVIVPKGLEIRYKESNIDNKVQITEQEGEKKYHWEARNQKALIDEPLRGSFRTFLPLVTIVPVNFEIENFIGNQTSWNTFGSWISRLNAGKNNLSDETKVELQNLVKDAKTEYDKIKIIYEYMQGRTRYVSIQIGLGGWQPFDAATVHRLSFGDCKALANYMVTMLDAIGIKSRYLLVNAGENAPEIMVDFPSAQFNHAFVCVPLKTDTIWLECTNQRFPCGYIGDFTDDRDVLLINGDSSKIVHTKIYTADDNTESRFTQVIFSTNNGGEAVVKTNYKGLNYEQILPVYLSDEADKKKKINNRINLPTFQLNGFSYIENRNVIPSIDEKLNISFQNYTTTAGQRVFMPLNFINRFNQMPERVRNRKTDVLIRRAFTEIDTVSYELPAGFKLESLPSPVDLSTRFGQYKAKAEKAGDKIIYTRFFRIFKGKYPPEAYYELLDFLEKVASADNLKCSFLL